MKLNKENLAAAEHTLCYAEDQILRNRKGDVSLQEMQDLILAVARSSAFIALVEYHELIKRPSV
jgi:hypothetical protein